MGHEQQEERRTRVLDQKYFLLGLSHTTHFALDYCIGPLSCVFMTIRLVVFNDCALTPEGPVLVPVNSSRSMGLASGCLHRQHVDLSIIMALKRCLCFQKRTSYIIHFVMNMHTCQVEKTRELAASVCLFALFLFRGTYTHRYSVTPFLVMKSLLHSSISQRWIRLTLDARRYQLDAGKVLVCVFVCVDVYACGCVCIDFVGRKDKKKEESM